jgi:hypothetical protein
MPQQGVNFDGSYISLPGAYYADDVSAGLPTTPPVTPPMIILGYGWGPKPQTINTYTTPTDFQNAVRGAPISTFIPFVALPSPNLFGASQITFIDVSENTQAVAALTTSGAAAYLSMTSTLYGPPSNQLTYQVSNPSVAGRKLTLTDNFGGAQFIGDNLGVPFQVAYLGTASASVSYVVSLTSGVMNLSSPNANESASLPIGSGGFNTTSLLTEAINGTGFWAAQGLSSTGGQLPSLLLDASSGVLTSGSPAAPNYVNVPAGQNDMLFWINQFAQTIVTAATGAGAVSGFAALPVTGAPTFFSGAMGVPPVTRDYASGLAVALTTPGWTVVCDSNAQAVQALLAAHVELASTPPYGSWRRGFTGSSPGDSIATTETNARNLDSLQMCYVYPGIFRTNTATGQNQLYGGLYAAFAAAAIANGNIVALPLTNKALNGNGVEAANAGSQLNSSQLTSLENNGVMALWQTSQTNGPPTILSDVTTWQVDNNVENTSSQQVACRYWLAYSVINTLRNYVGTIATPVTEVNILNALKKTLNALVYTGGSSNGVLTPASSDGTTVPWSNLQLNYDGTQQLASITVNVTLVGQNKFITCFASVQPLEFQVSAAA